MKRPEADQCNHYDTYVTKCLETQYSNDLTRTFQIEIQCKECGAHLIGQAQQKI